MAQFSATVKRFRSHAKMRPIVTDVTRSVVCLCMLESSAKTDEPIDRDAVWSRLLWAQRTVYQMGCSLAPLVVAIG